jgi:hypothetical protein
LRLQPLHHNGVTLSNPLRVDSSLATSAWRKQLQSWPASAKVLNLPKAKESYRYSRAASVDPP